LIGEALAKATSSVHVAPWTTFHRVPAHHSAKKSPNEKVSLSILESSPLHIEEEKEKNDRRCFRSFDTPGASVTRPIKRDPDLKRKKVKHNALSLFFAT
jgi:hypothetical protein